MRRLLVGFAVLVGACGGGAEAEPEPAFNATEFCVESVQHYLDWELDDPDAYSQATENRAWSRCEQLLGDERD